MEHDGMEQGIHTSGAGEGWTTPLICTTGDGRELARVIPSGEVWIAPDLTLDEARALIEQLARAVHRAQG